MKYLEELKSLNLPTGKFAIFGSGPMAIRNIRDCVDLDIIVKQDLWDTLLKKYPTSLHNDPAHLKIGNIEFYNTWLQLTNKIDEIIDNADMFDNPPFVQLEYVIEWKKEFSREKDVRDLELIQKYQDSQK